VRESDQCCADSSPTISNINVRKVRTVLYPGSWPLCEQRVFNTDEHAVCASVCNYCPNPAYFPYGLAPFRHSCDVRNTLRDGNNDDTFLSGNTQFLTFAEKTLG